MDIAHAFLSELGRPVLGDELFDAIPDTVYFIKDRSRRYVVVNQTLVERTGHRSKAEIIGRAAEEVFTGSLGKHIGEQDRVVLESGRSLKGELELHLYADGSEGWCLTWKELLLDKRGTVAGLIGLSRDVRPVSHVPAETKTLSTALKYAREHLDQAHRLNELAAMAKLSTFQFDQRIRLLFGLSAGQYLTRLRIEYACDQLRRSSAPIAEIALDCGYADQTAFARQFRKVAGLSPLKYRNLKCEF